MKLELPTHLISDATLFPIEPDIVGALGRVGDYCHELDSAEFAAVEQASQKRRNEFSTGRHLAQKAFSHFGLPRCQIPRAQDRQPVWPKVVLGSISHSDDYAFVALCRSDGQLRALGVDIELEGGIGQELLPSILVAEEMKIYQAHHRDDEDYPTLIFSAKEAVFKAIYPITGAWIDFDEIFISIDYSTSSFRASYRGIVDANRIADIGAGIISNFQNHHVCLFTIGR